MMPNKNGAGGAFWENVEAVFTPGRFALLLLALIFVTFPEILTGTGTFFHRDFGLFTYPVTHWQKESWWRGEVPLWNPLSCCGVPFLAQWNTAVLYPPSVFCLIFPLSWSLGVLFLGHLFLAGMGMYFLAFRWTESRFAAAVAGTAFTFSALLLNCLMWTSNLAVMAWMPWVVWSVERAWRTGGRAVLTAALMGAVQMLAGAPELIVLTWVLITALMLEQFFWTAQTIRFQVAGRFVAVVLIVAGLSAVQLLPFVDLLKHSDRDLNYSAEDWSMPGWGLANFLIPLYRSCPTIFGIYTQPEQFWIFSYYLGIGTVALACLACWRMRRVRGWLLAALTVGCLMLALGEHGWLHGFMRRALPQLSLMRYPVKFVALPTLLIPLLAAFALKDFLTIERAAWRRRAVILLLLMGGLIGWLIWTVHQNPSPYADWQVTAKSGLTRLGFLILILGLLWQVRSFQRPSAQVLTSFGIILLFWLDSLTNGPRPAPMVPRWLYEPNLARREARLESPPALGKSRLMMSRESNRNMRFSTLSDPAENYLYSRLSMFDNCNLLDDLPKVDGFFSLNGAEVVEVLETLYRADKPPAGLLDFLSVSHLTAPGKNLEWQFRPTHLPWITAGQRPVFADREKTLAGLAAPDFNPRDIVYLPESTAGSLAVSNASTPQLLDQQFSNQRLALQVVAAEPVLVVVAQALAPGWHARLDGQAVEIFRANHAFQAVAVPAGTHQLEFVYEDRAFRTGAIISGVTLAACLAGGMWSWRRKQA